MSIELAPLPASFRLRLEMRTDWHVGTGAGRRGDVDRAVARDADGLPYVPGRTVTGIWRDACEQVARALDGADDGPWSALVERVFGSQPALERGPHVEVPRPAGLAVRPARMNARLRDGLVGHGAEQLRDALTFVKPGIRIDARSGRAQDRALRSDEMARAGAVLWADCTLALEPELSAHATALLCAGAVLADRLGGGRRRGSGRCELRISGADHEAAITWLADAPAVPAPSAAPVSEPLHPAPAIQAPAGAGWHEARLLIRLLSPAAFPRAEAGNVTRTFDHLPGRHLLPALTRLGATLGLDLAPAIGRGDIRILNGLPRVDEWRGAPVPRSLYRSKDPGAGQRLWNALHGHQPDYPKRLGGAYVAEAAGQLLLWRAETAARAHNAIDDADQRAGGDGGVYTIEALPAGAELEASLLVRSGLAAALAAAAQARGPGAWWSGLTGRHALGRSSKDDYGLVEMEVIEVPKDADRPVALTTGGGLRVLCRSDVVLRDDLLRPDPTARALGIELARLLGLRELRPVPDRSHVAVSRIDTWHTRWTLPRPSLIALAAGSVVEFDVTGAVDLDRLREVALAGVGERCAEGLGEVSFGDALLDSPWVDADAPGVPTPRPARPAPVPALDQAERGYMELIERSAWRSAIRSAAAARAETLAGELRWTATKPPRSQLGALRAAAREAESPGDGPAIRWLRRLREVPNRAERWPGGALDQVERLLTERDRVWELLDIGRGPALSDPGAAVERLRSELWHEALVTLLDACARRLTRAA